MGYYISTRGDNTRLRASEAILKGLANDGGLYVPQVFPKLQKDWKELGDLNYQELAFEIMRVFLKDFSEEELKNCIKNAYDDSFTNSKIAPIKKVGDVGILELFHGPTLAFKDMALTILPYLMTTSMKKHGIKEKVVIITATSGDTGKAALAGFAEVEGTEIIVFYPKDGVSKIQELQMITQKGENTHVVGIDGNFDDAQTGVKEIFENKDFNKTLLEKGYVLSSANSINIGRLLPQVVYYFYGYFQQVKMGEIRIGDSINYVVPTGNYGNILAGYWAKKLGLPINKLICASNENKILTDFLNDGEYDINREFKKTLSPSMDILVSSNLERLLYDLSDSSTVSKLIEELKDKGVYKINDEMKSKLKECFLGYNCDDEETLKTINDVYSKYDYIMDTHTSVAYCAYEKYKKHRNKLIKTVVIKTSSPFKFSGLFMQQQKDEAKAPHLWLVTGAIKRYGCPVFLLSDLLSFFLNLYHD